MQEANRVPSTLPTNTTTTRRNFFAQAASVAAGGAVLTLAPISPLAAVAASAASADPIFGLIEAHRAASAAHLTALAEQTRLEEINDPSSWDVAGAPCAADHAAFMEVIETAPVTVAGLRAWAAYLDELANRGEEWRFEDEGLALVATFVEVLENLGVTS